MMSGEKRLLEWLARASPVLESQIVSSGLSNALNGLLATGWADMIAHETVKDRDGAPAAAVIITEKGRCIAGGDTR
jgi:hypothetical protein